MLNVALMWQQAGWTLTTEALIRRTNSALTPDARGAYAMLSRKIGKFTPYVALGFTQFLEPSPGLIASAASGSAFQQGLATFDRVLQSPFDRRQWIYGVRMDLTDRLSFKMQYDQLTATRDRSTPRNGDLALSILPPGQRWDGRVGVVTAALDCVF
jgi:hypothetical protein